MKWNIDEILIAIWYYKIYGTVVSLKNSDYNKHLKVFASIQNRVLDESKATFRLKVMNIDSFKRGNIENSGGLFNNKTFNDLWNDESTKDRYKALMNISVGSEIEKTIETKVSSQEKIKHTDNLINLSNFSYSQDAEVSYSEYTLKKYLQKIQDGEIKIPVFQREFVWPTQDIIDFLNSLKRGFPFGNITVWSSDKNILDERNEIIMDFRHGNDDNLHNTTLWVIDGQQRTTSLIATIALNNEYKATKNIIFSFDKNEFKKWEREDTNYIQANHFLNEKFDLSAMNARYGENISFVRVMSARNDFLNRKIGVTKIDNAELNIAIDIFTQMNLKGKKLTLFQIVHARFLNSEIQFNLEEMYENWIVKHGITSKVIDPVTFIKTLYLFWNKSNTTTKLILQHNINPEDVSPTSIDKYIRSFDRAWEFLTLEMNFNPKLLPSSNIIRFLALAYYENGGNEFSASVTVDMKKYIKIVCLNDYYSSSTDAKIAKNISHIEKILKGENFDAIKKDFGYTDLTEDKLIRIKYNENSSKYLYILNLLFGKAKSLENNQKLNPYSSFKDKELLNIHHIIPKSLTFGNEKVLLTEYGDSIINLAPISASENKSISNAYPGEYYEAFKERNDYIDKTLSDLYINPLYIRGITKDVTINECITFWQDRSKELLKLINSTV